MKAKHRQKNLPHHSIAEKLLATYNSNWKMMLTGGWWAMVVFQLFWPLQMWKHNAWLFISVSQARVGRACFSAGMIKTSIRIDASQQSVEGVIIFLVSSQPNFLFCNFLPFPQPPARKKKVNLSGWEFMLTFLYFAVYFIAIKMKYIHICVVETVFSVSA